MNRFLKILLAAVGGAFPFLFLQAQITSHQNLPMVGDNLCLHAVDGVYCGSSGVNVLWNFSNCDIRDYTLTKRITSSTAGLRIVEPEMRKFYSVSGDTLFLCAYQTPIETIEYAQPQVAFVYPFNYGDSISYSFSGKGMFSETYSLSYNGTKVMMADAVGDLLLPDNKMLKNVLRVHSVTFNNKWLEGLESNLVDSATSKLEVNDEYYWFAKECRYPVFEYHIGSSYSAGAQVASDTVAYCYLPDSVMEKAVPYVENNLIGNNFENNSRTGKEENAEKLISYNISQTGNILHLSYMVKKLANVTFALVNNMGIVFQNKSFTCKPNEEHDIAFNCMGYAPGIYVIYINVNGIATCEKFKIK